jgi:hypothetical protein
MLGGSSRPLAVQIWDHMNEILANLHDLDFRKCGCPPSLPVPCARARTVPRGARRRCPVAPFLRRRFRCGPTLRARSPLHALQPRAKHRRRLGLEDYGKTDGKHASRQVEGRACASLR